MPPKTSRPHTKRDGPEGGPKSQDLAAKSGALPNQEQLLRQAVALWLRWNEAYEQVTAEAFQSRHDQRKLEAMMDEMDSVRRQAIDLSKKAIS